MLTRRQLPGADPAGLVARRPGPDGAGLHRRDGPCGRAGQGHHPRRPRDDRRQRRPEHRHPLRRRPLPQARPTLRLPRSRSSASTTSSACTRVLQPLEKLLADEQLAIVQGVGYPNPDRSHFESMDVWQYGRPDAQDRQRLAGPEPGRARGPARPDPRRPRGVDALPLALRGSATGVPTIHPSKPYDLDLASTLRNRAPAVRRRDPARTDPQRTNGV